MEHAVTQVLTLLVIAGIVGMAARRVGLPYTLALVVAGIALGFFHLEALAGLHLTPELLLPIFLPALLFEAAYHLDMRAFRRDAGPILLLAVVGVLVAGGVTAAVARLLLGLAGAPGFGWPEALLLGATIAATDPISVLAVFRSLGVPRRLHLLVEGESLLNDGVAVVVFLIVADLLGLGGAGGASGGAPVVVLAVRTFLWMAGIGVGTGLVLGIVASLVTRQVDDRLIEVVFSFVLAYGSFLVAEHFGASGVLACVTSGIVLGSFGRAYGMTPTTRVAVEDFWEFMAFFANSFIFFLVGIELDVPRLVGSAGFVLLGFLAVLAGRAAAVYGLTPLTRLFPTERIPPRWTHVLVWGGLRGSLSMVLVVGLPQDFPGRGILLLLVFGIVSLSLFVQGTTMGPLLAHLGLAGDRSRRLAYERARARAMMAARARAEVRRQSELGLLEPDTAQALLRAYSRRLAEQLDRAAREAGARFALERLQEAALHLLTVEEEALRHAIAEGAIGPEAARPLFRELARRRETLREGDEGEEALRRAVAEFLEEEAAASPPPAPADAAPTRGG